MPQKNCNTEGETQTMEQNLLSDIDKSEFRSMMKRGIYKELHRRELLTPHPLNGCKRKPQSHLPPFDLGLSVRIVTISLKER